MEVFEGSVIDAVDLLVWGPDWMNAIGLSMFSIALLIDSIWLLASTISSGVKVTSS